MILNNVFLVKVVIQDWLRNVNVYLTSEFSLQRTRVAVIRLIWQVHRHCSAVWLSCQLFLSRCQYSWLPSNPWRFLPSKHIAGQGPASGKLSSGKQDHASSAIPTTHSLVRAHARGTSQLQRLSAIFVNNIRSSLISLTTYFGPPPNLDLADV